MHLMSFYSSPYMSKNREESILKKLNKIRGLWFVCGVVCAVFAMYLLSPAREEATEFVADGEVERIISPLPDASESISENSAEAMIRASMAGVDDAEFAPKAATEMAQTEVPAAEIIWPQTVNVSIASGDTLIDILVRHGMDRVAAHRLCKEINKTYNLRNLDLGQKVTLVLDEDTAHNATTLGEEATSSEIKAIPALLKELTIEISKLETLQVAAKGGDLYDIKRVKKKLLTDRARAKTIIHSSLYGAAEQQGVPREAISQLIKNFSYEVDFQRDIKSGDALDMMYETKKTVDGDVVEGGDVVYAMLKTNGEVHKQYRFTDEHGLPAYYNEKGESIVKRLLRTPIDGARLSSGFGFRRHPILGYSKMHAGVDFAAARGTPIFASGDGVVTFAGYNGSYGKFVRIKHNDTFSTAYAHAHRIAPAVRKGTSVRQGQVIAYVGSTGRSTGPHLHYEILKNGRQVNPLLVKMTGNDKLQGSRLLAFKAHVSKLQNQLAQMQPNNNAKGKLASLR
jgi:murein DD-endopeptidase MepM/ murein hydrolase activator NlpD